MKKAIFYLVLILCISGGCQRYEIDTELIRASTPDTKTEDLPPSIFQDFHEKNQAGMIESLEEKLQACNIASDVADNMSSEDLVRNIIDYPLNSLVMFYDDPQMAVKLVIENSNLHKAFLAREDAADILLQYYDNSNISMVVKRDTKDFSLIPYSATMFIEHFIASDICRSIFKEKRQGLRTIISKKLEERLSQNNLYSYSSVKPLLDINDSLSLSLNITTTSQGVVFLGYTTIYTPLNHQSIEGILFSDYSDTERNDADEEALALCPNAILLRRSTPRYNCHSYAWHKQDSSNNTWLNDIDHLGTFQLQKYWTNDLYCESSTSNGADVVYYAYGDHSGIIQNNGIVISKWGRGPLMSHEMNACPYSTYGKRYFIKMGDASSGTIFPDRSIVITGDEQVRINTWHEYHLNSYKQGRTYTWTFTDLANPNGTTNYNYTCISTSNGGSYSMKCNAYGAYMIRVDEYINGINTAFGQKYVISSGL